MGVLIKYNGLGGKLKFSGASTGGFQIKVPSGVDADAQAFFDRVTAAGGTLLVSEQNAINTLVTALKATSIWESMKAMYPMVGSSAVACAQNLKNSSFTGTFSSGWTFTSNGSTPNGTSAYMNTGLNLNGTINPDNLHFSYYSRTQNSSISGGAMGSGVNGGDATYLAPYYVATIGKFFLSGLYSANAVGINNTTTTGLIVGSKTLINSRKLYLNSTLLATNSTSYTYTFSNNTVYLGALNYGSGAVFHTPFQCAFSSIGDGLSDSQVTDLYTAVQAFQTTLNRNV
jgi:hypothetical protein